MIERIGWNPKAYVNPSLNCRSVPPRAFGAGSRRTIRMASEPRLRDTDVGELNTAQFDRLRQYVGRSAETAPPEAVADNRDGTAAG